MRGAKPGDVVAIDLIELTPFGSGKSAILRDFGVLQREFLEPMALSSPVRDGLAWAGDKFSLSRPIGSSYHGSEWPPEPAHARSTS